MGYYTRVFCRSEKSPTFIELQNYMSSHNAVYRLEGEVDDNDISWTNFELHYKEGKHPIPVDLSWCDEEGSVGHEELDEILDDIGAPGLSFKKRKVIKHLRKTRYIVCNQLLSDLDDDGYIANDLLMTYFVNKYQGMIHAENEGYYSSDNRILLKAD